MCYKHEKLCQNLRFDKAIFLCMYGKVLISIVALSRITLILLQRLRLLKPP
jgi:hypothetical protein